MKMTYTRDGTAREPRVSQGRRGGKTATRLGAGVSVMTAADRQIDEIERTFTLRYEW